MKQTEPATDTFIDQRLFALDAERHDAFVATLDNSAAPGPNLKALLKRVPAWEA